MSDQNHSVSERVIETVAAEAETDPMDLPLLYETIDPDALDALIETLSDGEVTFQYAGFAITVESTGIIELDNRSISSNLAGG